MKYILRCCAIVLAALVLGGQILAQPAYPTRPIRLVVPYPPGGGSDLVARAVGQRMSESLGQPVVIDNRPGAASMVATEFVAKSPSDGYTIILSAAPHTINPLLHARPAPRYDALRDFEPVALLATAPMALMANPQFPASNLRDLLAMPRNQTANLSLATSGVGSAEHMTYEWLRSRTGLELNHVPYKGGGPALADAIAGHVPLVLNSLPPAVSHIKAGRLRVLATTGPTRSPAAPDAPTVQESGVDGFVSLQWYGLLAPAGTPREIVAVLHREATKALGTPEVRAQFASVGLDAAQGTPADFRAMLEAEVKRWSQVQAVANVKPDS